jgi:putative membrane protein
MKTSTILLLTGTLAIAACGQRNEAGNADVNLTESNALDNDVLAAPAPAPTTAQGFANAAAASDRFEIESSRLAETAGQSAAVKSFASQMVTAHTASTAKLKAVAAELNVAPDDTLTPDQQQKLDGLKGLKGAEFDSAYAAAQVSAHQAALDALNAYAASGDNPKLKELASGMVPTVTAHLNMAKGLK